MARFLLLEIIITYLNEYPALKCRQGEINERVAYLMRFWAGMRCRDPGNSGPCHTLTQ